MKLSAVKNDSRLAEQGDWVDKIPNLPGVRLKVRGAHNSDYRVLEAKLTREIPRSDRIEGVKPAEQDRILATLLLETVLIDWDGMTEDDETTPIAYTRDLGKSLLFDPDARDFREGVAWAAEVVANRRKAEAGLEVKN